MKNIFLIGITIFIVISSLPASANENKDYFNKVNQAELAIVKGQYKTALDYYRQAFKAKKKPLAQDLYNASICAIRGKSYKYALSYCRRLADKGVGKNFFLYKTTYKDLRGAKSWTAIIERAAKVKDSLYNRNKPLLAHLDSLYACDQYWHGLWGKSNHHDTALYALLDNVDDSLSFALMKIFKKNGYLSEDMLGVEMENDTVISDWPSFFIIMLHNDQGMPWLSTRTIPRRIPMGAFAKIFRQAIDAGQINPELVAIVEDRGGHGDLSDIFFGTNSLYEIYGSNVYINREANTLDNLKRIDSNRKDLGTYPLSDYIEKAVYKIINPNSPFWFYPTIISIKSFADEESRNKFMENSDLYLKNIEQYKTRKNKL